MVAVLGAALIPQPAAASSVIRSELVSYADLDLDTVAGQASLLERTNAASARVCVDAHAVDITDLKARALCLRESRADTAVRLHMIMRARQLAR
jgi:UrcA family protein